MFDSEPSVALDNVKTLSFDLIQQLISLIDLTNLNDNLDESDIAKIAVQSLTEHAQVAAVCVKAPFLNLLQTILPKTGIARATVVNFPMGDEAIEVVESACCLAIEAGADEIDVVFPYRAYLAGEERRSLQFIERMRQCCREQCLKVILETGAFDDRAQLFALSKNLIALEVDFLKTSTGQYPIGATFDAVVVLLQALLAMPAYSKAGLKISGGIKTPAQALAYLDLIRRAKGDNWINASHVRFGSSQLLSQLMVFA